MDGQMEELIFVKEALFEDKPFLLFKNRNGEFRVVEAESYSSYNLKPGTKLIARVRKKGCAGQEISELMHPKYKEGLCYPFIVKKSGHFQLDGTTVYFIVVADEEGNEYRIRVENSKLFIPGESVNCTLREQTQGRLNFSVI